MEAEFSDSGGHKLQVFLTNNPETGCSRTDEGYVITSPWGERTIKLRIDEEDEALVDALNLCIYHLALQLSGIVIRRILKLSMAL